MFNLFKKRKSQEVTVFAPLSGQVVAIGDVPDPAFALMGEGIAIKPEDGVVVAPVDGVVEMVFPTKHAVGIKTDNGLDLLIHIGINSVKMNGEGFTAHVNAGERVKVGQKLITFSLSLLEQKATSVCTPVIVTNPDRFRLEPAGVSSAHAGSTPVLVVRPQS